MTFAIYKQPLAVEGVQSLQMPADAEILCVQVQRGTPCIWYRTPLGPECEPRTIYTYGTGHQIDDPRAHRYVGTYQLEGGALVFHVFEEALDHG